jgi:mannitol-specific phosphotransferase system IIBC component
MAGGTLLIILANINSADILKTAVMAVVGAIVSFFVSLCLQWVIRKCRK